MHPSFNDSYRGTPPWDIGRPQREFVRLVADGEVRGRVLDVGCGTGEHAIFYAEHGHEVVGIDLAPLAIEKARKKAEARGSAARFELGDAIHLKKPSKKFDTVTDCGLFHVFTDPERVLFERSLRSVTKRGGTYFMLCFSPKEPTNWGGPRRVSEEEIREAFGRGWRVNYVREATIETTFHGKGGGHGLLSSITAR